MEIIHLVTGANPLQIVADAVAKSGPREDSTRIGSSGVVRRQAVDVSPLRRVNQVRKRKWQAEGMMTARAAGALGGHSAFGNRAVYSACRILIFFPSFLFASLLFSRRST